MIGDCGLTMQLINGQIKPEIGYYIFLYEAHKRTIIKNGALLWMQTNRGICDDENDVTKVFAISREEWSNL